MKILYVTDLHGHKWKYERIIEIAEKLRVTAIINGGDMLPHNNQQNRFITEYIDGYFAQLNSAEIYYLYILGNDDPMMLDGLFDDICSRYPFIINLAQRKFKIKDYEFIGMNWVVDYPFLLKDRCRMDTDEYTFQKQFGKGMLSSQNGYKEIDDWFTYAKTLPTIENELDKLVRPDDMSKSIYVIHMPPNSLGLDTCSDGEEIGSKAIYKFLKKNQPRLSLHGHIHESPEVTGKWYAKLGNTVCIQPGQLNDLSYVIIDLDTMMFDRIEEKYS